MSEQAALLGQCYEMEFAGQKLKIAPRDFSTEAAFSMWLEGNALRKVHAHLQARNLSPVEFEMHYTGWRQDCATEQYCYESLNAWKALLSPAGQKQMAMLQLQAGGTKGITMATVEKLYHDEATWKQFKALQAQADADPNRPMPWTAAAA